MEVYAERPPTIGTRAGDFVLHSVPHAGAVLFAHSGEAHMTALLVVLGVLATVVGGVLALLVLGEIVAVIVALVFIGGLVYALRWAPAGVRKGLAAAFGAVFLLAGAYGGYVGYTLASAFSGTDGPVDPADPAALASAQRKLDAAEEESGFSLELTADELTAVMQDALAEDTDHPLRSVTLTVEDGAGEENGTVHFEAKFKNGSLTASGRVGAALDAGAVQVEVLEVGLGAVKIPAVGRAALEDLVETVTDLNSRLEEQGADIQVIRIGGGSVHIVGTQRGGDLVSLETVLGGVRDNLASIGDAGNPPAGRTGPGAVAGTTAEGATYYVALGDSLAAGEGVSDQREGYVSRVHGVLAGGGSLGLRNFGVSGETSGSLIRDGQLDAALEFMRDNDVDYVTVDIGANDLLGHIFSADCEDSIEAPACVARKEAALAAYRANLDRILEEVTDASGDAVVVFLGTYNPFSFGFGAGVGREAQSDAAVAELNEVARELAEEHGVLYADGFTPMQGTASATTHMLDNPPDIHPVAIGYDVLASAIVDVLP